MTKPSFQRIIKHLQSCIDDAQSMQLKMLEHLLSMALIQAYDEKDEFEKDHEQG